MSLFRFYKYHSYGDDGILFDCREKDPKITKEQIIYLADRNFGIGSNFVVCLYKSEIAEDEKFQYFNLIVYNSNGDVLDFSVNAIRISCAYLENEIYKSLTKFNINGISYLAKLDKENAKVKVNIGKPIIENDFVEIHNKHHVEIVENFEIVDYSFNNDFSKNFVKIESSQKIIIRTVEMNIGEVFTSPLGVAASFAYCLKNNLIENKAEVETRGSSIMNANFEIIWEIEKPMLQNAPYSLIYQGEVDL